MKSKNHKNTWKNAWIIRWIIYFEFNKKNHTHVVQKRAIKLFKTKMRSSQNVNFMQSKLMIWWCRYPLKLFKSVTVEVLTRIYILECAEINLRISYPSLQPELLSWVFERWQSRWKRCSQLCVISCFYQFHLIHFELFFLWIRRLLNWWRIKHSEQFFRVKIIL